MALYAALVIDAVFFLVPLAVMVVTSFRPTAEITQGSIIGWPQDPTTEGWVKAWSSACIGTRCEGLRPYFWNSVWIVIPATLFSTALRAINGLALTKFRFPGADALILLLIMGCFLPLQGPSSRLASLCQM